MKLAISVWENRIAPLFDVSSRLVLINHDDNHNLDIQRLRLGSGYFKQRIDLLKHLDLNYLICGGITQKMYQCLTANGIIVVPFLCGDINHIIQDFFSGKPISVQYLMPGGNRLI